MDNATKTFAYESYEVTIRLTTKNEMTLEISNPQKFQKLHLLLNDDTVSSTPLCGSSTNALFKTAEQIYSIFLECLTKTNDQSKFSIKEEEKGQFIVLDFTILAGGSIQLPCQYKFQLGVENLDPIDILQMDLSELKKQVAHLDSKVDKDIQNNQEDQQSAQKFQEILANQNQMNQNITEMNQAITALQQSVKTLETRFSQLKNFCHFSPTFNTGGVNASYCSFGNGGKKITYNGGTANGYCAAFATQALPKGNRVKFSVLLEKGNYLALGLAPSSLLNQSSCYGSTYSIYGGNTTMYGFEGNATKGASQGQVVSVTVDTKNGETIFELDGEQVFIGNLPQNIYQGDLYPFVEFWSPSLSVTFI